MPKYTLVSDIHANYPALEAVLQEEDNDGLICLGDMVGLWGFPQETVSTIKNEALHAIAGNHDVAVLEYGEGHVNDDELSQYELEYTQENLDDDLIDWVNSLGTYGEMRDGGILLAHARPNLEESSGYSMGNRGVGKGEIIEYAAKMPDWVDYVFLGHTHEQYYLDCNKFGHDVMFVNPGSLGFDSTYIVIDMDKKEIYLKSAEYDHEIVKERVRDVAPKIWW